MSRAPERIPEWRLGAEDTAAIAALLRASFPTDFGGRSFYQQRPHLRIVWREGVIVGHLALTFRAVRLGERLVDIAGIGDVACLQARRGRGIGGALLSAALDEARSAGMEHALLFGDRSLYRRAGFGAAGNVIRSLDLTGARTGDIREAESAYLRVLPLSDRPWDATAPLDLLGWRM